MSMSTTSDPKERFSNLAGDYALHRPSYPPEAIAWMIQRGGLTAKSLVADVGAGTGISTRQLAAQGIPSIGIEPNGPMLAEAAKHSWPGPGPRPRYQAGTGEVTGLADESTDAVLAAQAFHWFDPAKALAEFRRILKPGGWVFLMWNERHEADDFTNRYGNALRQFPDTKSVEAQRHGAGDALLHAPGFGEAERVSFHHEQKMDQEGLLGRARSVSYGPKTPEEKAKLEADLRTLFGEQQQDGKVSMKYVTTITAARKI